MEIRELASEANPGFHRAQEEAPSLQRVGALVEIPRLLKEMKIAPESVLGEIGLPADALNDVEGRLPFPLVSDLIMKCVEATGRSDFPLIVGASARLNHLGVIGTLLAHAPDFGSALLEFVANHPRYVRGASVYLIDWDEKSVLVGHRVHYPGLRGAVPFSVGAAVFGCKIFAELCGVVPTQVLLTVSGTDKERAFKRAFGRTKVIFGAEHLGLVYSRTSLKQSIPTADPIRFAETRTFVSKHWNSLQPNIRDRVMRVLVPLVLSGTPSRMTTARLLVMHPRTLNRALKGQGTSFREAVNEARFEMASQLLRETRVSVSSLALTLGYSEVSAFTRFFTSMAGISPSEWKERELTETGDQPGARSGTT